MLCQGHPAAWTLRKRKKLIVRWIAGCAEIGCAKSASEVMAIVGKKKGSGDITVSRGWWE